MIARNTQPKMTNLEAIKVLKLHDTDFVRSNTDFIIQSINQSLEKDEISLCHIVEGLQSTLTNSNPTERALGISLLADTLQSISLSKINEKELNFLCSFFCDRLKDHHSIIPYVIIGIMALVKQINISGKDVQILVQSVFREAHCQSQVMSDRRNIYNLLKFCLLNKEEEMKKMSTEFVLGFISAMEGEKDPRNLVLLFSLFPQIVRALPLLSFAEDMFELVAAYFPIEFVPPKNDPYGVLPEDLIVGLRGCLASTDAFAPYCIPLLQEKLDSDSIPAKIESLLTLQACCETYSGTSLKPFAPPLWESLRREVLEGANPEVEQKARDALSAYVAALERDSQSPPVKDALTTLGTSAIFECLPHLSSPEQRLMVPSRELLLAAAVNSASISAMVVMKVLPLLCEQFTVRSEFVARKNILIALTKFLSLGGKHKLYEQDVKFQEYQSQCLKVLSQGLESTDAGVRESVLRNLPSIIYALTKDQVREIGHTLLQAVMQDSEEALVGRGLAVEGLKCVENANSSFVTEEVMPKFLDLINKAPDEETMRLRPILDAVPPLSSSVTSVEAVLPVVWGKAVRLCREGSQNCIYYLRCIRKITEGKEGEKTVLEYLCRGWKGLLRCQLLAASCILSPSIGDPVPVLEEVSGICQNLIVGETSSVAEELVEVVLGSRSYASVEGSGSLLEEDGLATGSVAELDAAVSSPFIIFSLQGLTQGKNAIAPSESLGLSLKKVWGLALSSHDRRVREGASLLFASLFLRIPSEKELSPFLLPLEEELLKSSPDQEKSGWNASRVWFLGWVVKALIMRAHSQDLPWIQKLERLLLDPELGKSASDCYGFLLQDDASLIPPSPTRRPVAYRMLYKQRFFMKRIDAMVVQFRSSESSGRTNTLLAISYLLPCLPQAVLKGHLQKLLPVLSQGLTTPDAVVSSGAVGTLESLLRHNAEDVTSHLSSLVPPLISLGVTSTINVRVKALGCLESLAQLPPIALMQLKEEVVRGLQAALGDKKRVVRRAATAARSAWILL